MMVVHGIVRNGVVVFGKEVALPEGTEVRVEVITSDSMRTLAERFAGIVGTATDLPEDLAAQHDHYIHGTPKR